jgi:hypothetical protein
MEKPGSDAGLFSLQFLLQALASAVLARYIISKCSLEALPMRPAVLLIIAAFTLVPALLMMFSQGRPLLIRVMLGAAIFLAPFALIVMVQTTPALNGSSVQHGQAWRAIGVFLSTASFILPWALFALLRGK